MLWPLSLVYRAVIGIRKLAYRTGLKKTYRAPVPVVIVGNIYIGGTGKTPVILSLIEGLRSRGWRPGLISRGYGSHPKQAPVCGQGRLEVSEFGDEPAMISLKTGIPVSVHPDRPLAAQTLLRFDPSIDVILSDDGLQHWALARDIELLVQDERGIGNGMTLPAGPLREPPSRSHEVDAVLTRQTLPDFTGSRHIDFAPPSGDEPAQASFCLNITEFQCVASGSRLTAPAFVRLTAGRPDGLLAIAGIGVPERFFASLRLIGVRPTRTQALPDHGHIEQDWLSKQPEGTILMTEKDAVRLSGQLHSGTGTNHSDRRLWFAIARTEWRSPDFMDWISQRLHAVAACRRK